MARRSSSWCSLFVTIGGPVSALKSLTGAWTSLSKWIDADRLASYAGRYPECARLHESILALVSSRYPLASTCPAANLDCLSYPENDQRAAQCQIPFPRYLALRPQQATKQQTNPRDSDEKMEGECLCKAVAVKVNDDNLFGEQRRGHFCHCANCRKVAGGMRRTVLLTESWGYGINSFGANLTIEEEKVEFPRGKGNLKVYTVRRRPPPPPPL
ncbi:hypothetical protein AYO21_04292 [Fonsecaea monophora]|uniref:CENP-V/GFA domain-containing protein n=1 Tax=Fonsecaea monophora TaxID=254056 RepID=A0A177FCM0_9EURO|nr:hypothetical protein AYO21_04292 [Fonsecaea monophora]OAG41350.1 hypothetical protein AYO21_04292 [Fonsecaea monophora]